MNQQNIDNCIDQTFTGPNKLKDDNAVFAESAAQWRDYGHNMYPSMIVNGKIFRGRLTPDNAIEDICSSFKHLPKPCSAWY